MSGLKTHSSCPFFKKSNQICQFWHMKYYRFKCLSLSLCDSNKTGKLKHTIFDILKLHNWSLIKTMWRGTFQMFFPPLFWKIKQSQIWASNLPPPQMFKTNWNIFFVSFFSNSDAPIFFVRRFPIRETAGTAPFDSCVEWASLER